MCTAVSYKHYFGRNLDWDFSFGENVIITPRNYEFTFTDEMPIKTHYAIMGIGIVKNNYPLYFDAMNEFGLCVAGLNFPDNAIYFPEQKDKTNITPYEFIPYILGKCENVAEVLSLVQNMNFLNIPFSGDLPLSPLHWIISDSKESITVEPLKSGCKICKNPVGVLTNNPTFDIQLHNLNNYINVSPFEPESKFAKEVSLKKYSRGMGGIGLPGDYSSQSRFVKAVFVKFNIVSETEKELLSSFFHILSSVSMPKGCVISNDKGFEHTVYSDCYDTKNCLLHFKIYANTNISKICLNDYNLDRENLMTIKSDH